MGTRSEPNFFLGEEKVQYTCSYAYLGVTFTGPRFSLQEATCAQLSRGYTAIGALERLYALYSFRSYKLNCGYLIHVTCDTNFSME